MSDCTPWELVDDGSFNGLRKWMRGTPDDHGTVEVRYEGFDVPLILDDNKAAQNESFDRRSEMWHAAKIPASVILKWRIENGIDFYDPNHKPAVMRMLNSSEWRHLRRTPFQI